MNGIEKITQMIHSDAQAEIDALLAKAREEAAQTAARYEAQAKAESEELLARQTKAAAEREERLVSAAQMEGRKMTLAAKQEMVERAYQRALEKLQTMPEQAYTEVLAALLVQASATGREEAIFSPKDRERVGKAAVEQANQTTGKRLTLSQETRPMEGGFILRDGNVEVNCAFETLVRLERAQSAGMVAKRLFA